MESRKENWITRDGSFQTGRPTAESANVFVYTRASHGSGEAIDEVLEDAGSTHYQFRVAAFIRMGLAQRNSRYGKI